MSMNAAHVETIRKGVGRFGIDVEVVQEHGETTVIVRQDGAEITIPPELVLDLADALQDAADYADQ
ncbi:hypothetical protein [Dietzia sp. ANT_WB102]|uniref:hypothetical protein n=1 Tax=Dietzia sp. ANT_WB102 TaxID=2597345 RepID=UPI0011EFD112|nr:hypothetical protein [Dietzia sp. ANT_WB102]KAA0918931.1 hypothetical protein FQ137_06420 [Dietzia sp. ANT_WB102]